MQNYEKKSTGTFRFQCFPVVSGVIPKSCRFVYVLVPTVAGYLMHLQLIIASAKELLFVVSPQWSTISR